MHRYIRPISIGATVGALASLIFIGASFLFSASADEEPLETMLSTKAELFPRPFNTDNLVKFDDAHYLFTVEPQISLTPTSTVHMHKIGYGKMELVTIATTASGVYSSDGLTSPHIRYPGIHVERFNPADAGSLVIVVPGAARALSCFYEGSIAVC